MTKKFLSGILFAAAVFLLPCLPAHAASVQPSRAEAAIDTGKQSAAKPASASKSTNVYRKLQTGKAVRIAILGDSIAAKAGAEPDQTWDALLYRWLLDEYHEKITVDNYAIGGTNSYMGYYQCETALRAQVQQNGCYDLIVICYGQNDAPENFCLYYEAMLRSAKKQNPSCQFITFLESSQHTYTSKMQEIIRLSELYGADIADTISAFAASGLTYEELAPDGTHPNAAGHQIYFETIRSVIEANVDAPRQAPKLPAVSSPYMTLFEDFSFISIDQCRTADGQYVFTSTAPMFGILFCKYPGGGNIRLDFSTGEAWADTGNSPIEWTAAVPIHLLVAPGTTVTLTGDADTLENTVIGFISSGHLPD